MKTFSSSVLAAMTALVLVACGGGGSDDSSPATYAVNTAQRHLLVDGGSWSLTGPAPSGGNYTVVMSLSPTARGTPIVGSTLHQASKQTYTLQQGGVTTSSGGPTLYFDDPGLVIVQTDNGDSSCSVATSNTALPNTASVGASGAFFSLSDLDSCASGGSAVGITTTTWSLENDAGVALLCWNMTGKDLSGAVIGTVSSCVQITPDGALGTKARLTITGLGVSTTARNF